ncbi:peptidoglycan DD-metalloendopeptidase family protein [Pseudonocardia alni]
MAKRVHPLPSGTVTSGFRTASRPNHLGLDLAASTGTPVRAAADGTVTKSGWSSGGYGNVVYIEHAGGIETRYAHLSKFGKTGKVKAGDVIGYVGSTGDSTGPHLHFEVRDGGTAINPEVWLRGASKAPAADPAPKAAPKAPDPKAEPKREKCEDRFRYQQDAQDYFDAMGYTAENDPERMDDYSRVDDGVPCEMLPDRPATAAKKPSVESYQVPPKVTPRVTVPDGARFTPGGDGEYVVEPGDTLSQLAVDHLPEMVRERGINATVDHLVEINRDIVEMPGWIFVGERLHLR